MLKAKGCLNCHDAEKKKVGPSFNDIAAKFKGKQGAAGDLVGGRIWVGNAELRPPVALGEQAGQQIRGEGWIEEDVIEDSIRHLRQTG